jgi:hypothetical protein
MMIPLHTTTRSRLLGALYEEGIYTRGYELPAHQNLPNIASD